MTFHSLWACHEMGTTVMWQWENWKGRVARKEQGRSCWIVWYHGVEEHFYQKLLAVHEIENKHDNQ